MSQNLFDVEGLNVVITGGAGGIGAAITQGYLDCGANVIVVDKSVEKLIDTKSTFIGCDLSEKDDVDQMLAQVDKLFENTHVLINAAGVTRGAQSQTYSFEDWRHTLAVNLEAAFLMCQHFGRSMINKKIEGSIINVTSIGAELGFPNNPAYAASKGGLKTLTKALSVEWGEFGIRVNNLTPGYTETPMNKRSISDPSAYRARAEKASLGRWAVPIELVGPAIFLGSNASRFITGADLVVDGGWTSKGM